MTRQSAYSHCFVTWYAPNDTPEARRSRGRFRSTLNHGAQRHNRAHCGHGWTFLNMTATAAEKLLLPLLPADGELRIFGTTDKQLEHQRNYWGKRRIVT